MPAALLNNLEHNHVVHEQVVLLTVETGGRSARPGATSGSRSSGCGWASSRITAQLRLPGRARRAGHRCAWRRREGLEIDLEQRSYYVNHVIADPGRRRAAWRPGAQRLFTLLYQNSTPAARYFHIPPDRVFEVGAYVQI